MPAAGAQPRDDLVEGGELEHANRLEELLARELEVLAEGPRGRDARLRELLRMPSQNHPVL